MKAFFSFFFVFFILSGCLKTEYAYERKVFAWKGKKAADLIEEWGAPSKIHKTTGKGGDLYEYLVIKMYDKNGQVNYLTEERKSLELDGDEGYINKQYRAENRTYRYERCFTWFQLDEKQMITQVWYKGSLCKSLPVPQKKRTP